MTDDPDYMDKLATVITPENNYGFRGKLLNFPSSTGVPGSGYLSRLVRFGVNQRARRPVFMIDLLVGDDVKLESSDSVILTDNPSVLPPSIFTGIKVSISVKRAPVNQASSLS